MSSNNSSFFLKIFHNARKNLAFPRSEYEGKPPQFSPSSVTRMRSFTLAPQSHGSDRLPLYYANTFEIEKLDYHPKSPLSFSTKIVCLIFTALGYQNQTIPTSKDQPSILGAAMVIAFAASFSVMFIKHSYPRLTTFVEKIGIIRRHDYVCLVKMDIVAVTFQQQPQLGFEDTSFRLSYSRLKSCNDYHLLGRSSQ